MPLLQVTYKVPDRIALGLATGEFERFGSVVRNNTQIIGHLKEVSVTNDEKKDSENNTAAIVVVVAAGLAFALGAAYGIGYLNKKHNMKKAVQEFQNAFSAYKEAIENGELSQDVLYKLDNSLEQILNLSHKGLIKISYVPEVFEAFKEIVADYTKQLAEKNSVDYNDNELEIESDEKIIDIRNYLYRQAEIINICSR